VWRKMKKENAEFVAVEIPKEMYEDLKELAGLYYSGDAETLLMKIIRDYQSER
jgi:hypothetical protein